MEDDFGRTALHHAARNKNWPALSFIFHKQYELQIDLVNIQTKGGETALMKAAMTGNLTILKFF